MKITSTELESWSNTRVSQEKLPLLLRKLIINSVDDKSISYLDIPGGDSIWKPGVDGRVQTLKTSILGEAGLYDIECGQEEDYKKKFVYDISKRSENLSVNTDTIFVFITTRKIQNKENLIKDIKENNYKTNFWKNIKIFDADNIETWLDNDYATRAWMCDLLEKPCDGVYDFNKKWNMWIASTIIPINEQIILARKNIYEKEINNWLLYDNNLLEVRANSKKESLMYLLASIENISSIEKKESLKSQITIIEDGNQWHRIVENGFSKNLILIPMFGIPDGLAMQREQGYKIYIPLEKTAAFQTSNIINLDNINNYLLEPILEKQGGYELRNKVHRAFSDGDLLLLQRILRKPDTPLPKPEWASKSNPEILLFLSMFSSWNDKNSKDTLLCEQILNIPYADIKKKLITLTNIEEAPIQQIGNVFQVSNPELIIEYFGTYLTTEYLTKLLDAAKKILTNIDKDYTKEKARNYLHEFDFTKNEEKYSEQIKSASSQGLALFSNNNEHFNTNIDIKSKISQTINDIFEENDYTLWLFLSSYIQMLFEAAPQAMLVQNKKILNNNGSILKEIIEYSSPGFGGRCYYAGILWGLESISWIPNYLRETTEILLKMEKYWTDCSGYSNSPLSSLHKIYCAWCPHTSAERTQRESIISLLIETNKYNDVMIKLLEQLLPQKGESIIGSSEPKYIKNNKLQIKNIDVYKFYNFVFEQLLILLDNTNDWDVLIERYFEISTNQKQKLFDKLNSLNFENISDEKKIEIKRSILLKNSWFDEYGEDKDFSSEDIDLINKLKIISNKITFSEKYKQYIALFTIYDYQNENDDYKNALIDILNTDGVKGILFLAKQVKKYEYKFIEALKYVRFSDEQVKELIAALGEDEEVDKILFNFIGKSFSKKEMHFINIYWNNDWSDIVKKNMLLNLSTSMDLWQWIETNGFDKVYWGEQILRGKFPSAEFEFILKKVKKHNKDALLELVFYNKDNLSLDVIIDALFSFTGNRNLQLGNYYIKELFNILYKSNIEYGILLQLEIKYIEILDYRALPKTLKKEIADPNSSLFSDIIRELYIEDGLTNEEIENIRNTKKSEDKERVQKLASKLRIRMDDIFIFDDISCIKLWFDNNKKRLQELNRLNIGVSLMGEMFGQSPKDASDNIWPIKEIRDIIENEEDEDFDRAICIGKYNSVGVRSITPEAQDMWDGYNEYRNFAKLLRFEYPRTANILETIADEYKNRAQSDENSYKQRYY